MAIEGLNNIYGIPPVKKEQEPNMNKRKKQKREPQKRDKKKEEQQKIEKGRVDIRI
jgi:hypothetical protein